MASLGLVVISIKVCMICARGQGLLSEVGRRTQNQEPAGLAGATTIKRL